MGVTTATRRPAPEETIQTTIKIRQAGFADCIDTHQSFRRQLTRLRELRIIP
jgi:hypothetical protein